MCLFIEEDGVVVDTAGMEEGGQLRPDGIVPSLVLALAAWVEEHLKSPSVHMDAGLMCRVLSCERAAAVLDCMLEVACVLP